MGDTMPCSLLKSQLTIWMNMSPPPSGSKNKPHKKPAWSKQQALMAYSLTLKMEATCSSKTSVDFQWTILHYIPEDRTLDNHSCENLKFHVSFEVLIAVVDQTVTLCSFVDGYLCFRGTWCLHLKKRVAYISKTLVSTYKRTQWHNQEDHNLKYISVNRSQIHACLSSDYSK
jgi:hypothetical protein